MLDTERINNLYTNVLNWDMYKYKISGDEVKCGIETLQSVYNKETTSLGSVLLNLADYNDPAHRCAYLHKYAALHTTMVRDMMYSAVQMNYNFFHEVIFSSNPFKICCLGGGPGTDVIGVLAALHESFSYFPTSVTIADYMTNWRMSFLSILQELGSGLYGAFGNNVHHFLNWSYLGADLLQKTLAPDVQDALSNASLVTMIKFASAAACVDTAKMIENIFTLMKPGAILFFIDNDAGGFNELIMNGAREYNFISIFGPIRHENYCNDGVRIKRFGYVSCHKTTVTVHILQKPIYCDNFASPFVPSTSRPILLEKTIMPGSPFVNNGAMLASPYSPIMLPPYTPLLTPDKLLGQFDFSADENLNNSAFVSLSVEISHTPKSIKKSKLNCLPLKRWKHNLARKINIVKSSLLRRKKKSKKPHPVSRL